MKLDSNDKAYKIKFLSLLFLLFLLIWILSNFFVSLKVLYIIPFSILLGIGFTSLFKEIFPIKNIFLYIGISIFLGLFLNTFILFFLCLLGVTLDIHFFMFYTSFVVILSILVFFFVRSNIDFANYIKNTHLESIDKVWITFYILLFILFLGIGLQNYFPNWDSFNFWAVDSKYIFQNSTIRKPDFDLLNPAYLSFYPIQLNYIYLMYGDIVEQYSSILTMIYAFLGCFIIVGKVIELKRDSIRKSLLYSSLFPIIYSFYQAQGLIFTQYADIFCSVLILFFCLILFSDNYAIPIYWKRFLMLSLIAISIYLTKTNYVVVAIFLLLFYLVYDFKYVYENISEIISRKKFIISFFVLLYFLFIVYSYASSFRLTENIVQYTLSEIEIFNPKRFSYLFELTKFLFSELTLLFIYFLVIAVLSFVLSKGFKEKQIIKLSFLILLSMIPLGFYIVKLWGFEDMSLLRYIGLIFFAFPYLMIGILPPVELNRKIQKKIFLITLLLLPAIFVLKIIDQSNYSFKFSPNTGSYRDFIWHKEFYLLGEKVKSMVPSNSTIMLVDQEGELIGNMNMPIIILRYSLSNYSVGHQYRFSKQEWYEYMLKFSPDYILVFTYDDYWVGCNDIIETDNTYLIRTDNLNGEYNSESCFFSADDIIKL